ncbi:DEAD/DEAH box helicase [Leptospira wolffii]|uniref:DEAD/DEAH box helicase n=1 Tax=Leptospira wolffii TaxID=409998 RepID=UPI001082EDD5|nr:DEAD/DEAH box helicase [Leptospira wolffii]TGL55285.1 DEAD/DEAH box helicase [Leptospira wolffii]
MYNTEVEEKIKNIPKINNIDLRRLPQELTKAFAEITDLRRKLQLGSQVEDTGIEERLKMLKTLALNLETLISIVPNRSDRDSIAFVSATAHYLLLQFEHIRTNRIIIHLPFDIDSISSGIAAIVLFMIGNSPADAAEVSLKMEITSRTSLTQRMLYEMICYLARGELLKIIDYKIEDSFEKSDNDDDEIAVSILWEKIALGLKQLALVILGKGIKVENFFHDVINLSISEDHFTNSISLFAGPHHLATLLSILENDLIERSIMNTEPPSGLNSSSWKNIIENIAVERPYLWENHYEAIKKYSFLSQGISAVLTFPTGAGKSTLSELKVASTLLSGKSIIYLVPTHSLEEQVNANMIKTFPDYAVQSNFEIDSEFTEIGLQALSKISVMTPERCLTVLGINSAIFKDVGLIVFDEFHLISGKESSYDRRNLDSMLCLLMLFTIVPEADYLLISAMVENGKEIADWITTITNRPCESFSSAWKPTRQMQGCVVYQKKRIDELYRMMALERAKGLTKFPGVSVKKNLNVSPLIIFSLRNMWESKQSTDYFIADLFSGETSLTTNNVWGLTSNKNEVASFIGLHFAAMGLKTLIFVDRPQETESTAKRISERISNNSEAHLALIDKYSILINKIESEFGSRSNIFMTEDGAVGIHHGSMLPSERMLAELLFKEKNGLNILVATPTLAQGVNLPAEVVIIAGDSRYNSELGQLERKEAHEILNAAGRAGRAGMSAQGIVIVIPADVATIEEKFLSDRWWELKNQVFSKSDQCLKIYDPLEFLLDSVQDIITPLSDDQKSIFHRINFDRSSDKHIEEFYKRSLGYFRAKHLSDSLVNFENKIKIFSERHVELESQEPVPLWNLKICSYSGLTPELIRAISNSIQEYGVTSLFSLSIEQQINLYFDIIVKSDKAIENLFARPGSISVIHKILNIPLKENSIESVYQNFFKIRNILNMWISGETIEVIDRNIEGDPQPHCGKGRQFVLKLIPDLSFALSVFTLIVKELSNEEGIDDSKIPIQLKILPSCIREGMNSAEKLAYKLLMHNLSRVTCHNNFQTLNLSALQSSDYLTFEQLVNAINKLI